MKNRPGMQVRDSKGAGDLVNLSIGRTRVVRLHPLLGGLSLGCVVESAPGKIQ